MRAPEFWNQHDVTARLAVALLRPFGWLYGASVAWKQRHAVPFRSRAKVICVGNLTAGGTGKTPIAIAIARTLMARGLNTVILTRGYGGRMRGPAFVDPAHSDAAETGDEALLLAAAGPVIVSRDRKAGAELADSHGADVIVMDDGHQNFSIEKDLSLVVVDGGAGFGNGHVLPAGPLREPVARGLARAQAVIVVGPGSVKVGPFAGPVLHALLAPVDVFNLRGARVVAFAGIGRPAKFFATLRTLGAEIACEKEYADHYIYTASEIARLKAKARNENAVLITTEKDFVRMTHSERQGIRFLPVRAAFEEPAVLAGLLDRIAPPRLAATA